VIIIVVGRQLVSAEIDDLVPGRAELSDQSLLQSKPAVVSANSYSHIQPFIPILSSFAEPALSAT